MNTEQIILRKQFNKSLINKILQQIAELNPDRHITLTWDKNHRLKRLDILCERARDFMAKFENKICGGNNWFRNYYKFIMFIEKHADNTLHAHILINTNGLSEHNINCTFFYMRKNISDNYPDIYITPVVAGTPEYVIKQMKPDSNGTIDTSHYITSDDLFGLPHKKKRHRKVKGYEKHNIKVKNTIGDYIGINIFE